MGRPPGPGPRKARSPAEPGGGGGKGGLGAIKGPAMGWEENGKRAAGLIPGRRRSFLSHFGQAPWNRSLDVREALGRQPRGCCSCRFWGRFLPRGRSKVMACRV